MVRQGPPAQPGHIDFADDHLSASGWNCDRFDAIYTTPKPNFRGYFYMEFSRPFDTCSALSRTQDFGLQNLAAAQLAELGAPCVREATLHIGVPYTPATLHIVVRNLSPECTTIRSITWNGQLVTDYRIHHNTLIQGGELVFEYEPSE